MRTKTRFALAAVLFMAIGALLPAPAAGAGAPTPAFVAGGFDSPRGVEFFQGTLVVGEAGHGGKNCFGTQPMICFGRTSQISWVNRANGTHTPLVDHLFSAAEFFAPGEGEALGVDGISARDGNLMAIRRVPAGVRELPMRGGRLGMPGGPRCREATGWSPALRRR